MDTGRLERVLPLAGVVFSILFVLGFIVTGETPDTNESADEIFKFYDDQGKILVGLVALGIGAILFMFFASALRKHLRATGPDWLSTFAFAGAVVFVVGLAGFASSQFSLLQAADDKNMDVLQTLNYLDNSNFPPAIIGLAILYIGVGWHALSSRSLPVWLGWVSIALGVLALAGPIGFIAFLAVMPWTFIVAILLYQRGPVAAVTT